jgi:hypothetical protein
VNASIESAPFSPTTMRNSSSQHATTVSLMVENTCLCNSEIFADPVEQFGISAAAGAFGEGLLSGAPPAPVPQNLTGLGFPLWMKQALRTAIAVATMPGAGHPGAGAGPIFGLGIGGQFGGAERCSRRKARGRKRHDVCGADARNGAAALRATASHCRGPR